MRILLSLIGWTCCLGLLGVAGVATASLGGAFSMRLDVLTHFAPIYLAIGLAGLVVSPLLGRGRRLIGLVLSLVSILVGGILIGPEVLALRRQSWAASTPRDLKIIQFNAWGNNAEQELAADWILRQDPDIVVIEEPGGLERIVARDGHYNRTMGSLSTAIVSKAPPDRTNSVDWSLPHYPSPVSVSTFVDERGRYAVIGVHRPWPSNGQEVARQASYLRNVVASYGAETAIVVGDFNSTPWSYALRREDRDMGLSRRTVGLFSWPADRVSHNRIGLPFAFLPIDHVYAGAGWKTVSVERGPRLGSDHYPVMVVLTPAAADGRLPEPQSKGDAWLAAFPYKKPPRD